MDPEEDQPTVPVGVIRWASGDTLPAASQSSATTTTTTTASSSTTHPASTTSHQHLRNKVTYYEKVWSSGQKPAAEVHDTDETDRGAFAIDVNAFEKRLQEERERKSHEQSPRIEVKLRSTPQPSPQRDLPLSTNIRVNIRHHIETGESSPPPCDANHAQGISHHSRVLTYEKVVSTKSVREVKISSTSATSPVVRTIEYTQLIGRSPSSERIAGADDSAYHLHRTRHVSSSTPTTVTSQSSSNTSLHGNFPSEENVFVRHIHQAQRTPSRERIFIRAGSEPPHSWSSSGTTSSGSNVGVAKIATASGASPVSSVAAGNNEYVRRHLARERHDSGGGGDSDGASSPDWYNEYRTHSFHTTPPPRMDFQRSNSQYDNHIRQIRGISCFLLTFFFSFFLLFSKIGRVFLASMRTYSGIKRKIRKVCASEAKSGSNCKNEM